MIRIELRHSAGWGSVLTLLFSQLADVPAGEAVSIFAQSNLYATVGENMFAWYFNTLPLTPGATCWSNLPFDGEKYPFNTQLGLNKERLMWYRQLRDRFFHAKPPLPDAARGIIGAGSVLGIHYRGTDKHTEVPRTPREAVLAKYQELARHRPIDRVFLATDEQASADWFAEHIPGLAMNEHTRTDDARGLHITQGSVRQADEAMLDIYCLAACGMLLVGRGNFSDMACIFSNTTDIFYAGA